MQNPSPTQIDPAFFGSLTATTRFFIVRHGQTDANARRVVQGLSDYRLDDSGRAQAAGLGLWLKDKGIDTILSSPLLRASETAEILASRLGLPRPEAVPELREIDAGRFSDLSLDKAAELYPADFAAFERLSWEGVADAERAEAVYARACAAWGVLRAKAEGGGRRVLCVTHGGFIQWLVRVTFGTKTWMPLLPTGNCGVFELLVEPVAARYGQRGAKLYWERINFQAPGDFKVVPPVF